MEKLAVPLLDDEKIARIILEVQACNLGDEAKEIVVALLISYKALFEQLKIQDAKIEQMRSKVLGHKTEKKKKKKQKPTPDDASNAAGGSASLGVGTNKKGGHGRSAADDYPQAEKVIIATDLKAGDACPECEHGKMYQLPASEALRFFGQALIKAKIFTCLRLRCSGCLGVHAARLPSEAGLERHHPTANAAVALMNYGSGMPFYRMEQLQKSFGCPLSDATQFEMAERVADKANPVFEALQHFGAQADKHFHDDTGVRIQSLMKENETLDP